MKNPIMHSIQIVGTEQNFNPKISVLMYLDKIFCKTLFTCSEFGKKLDAEKMD
jgi:hypothetical protein